MGHTTKRQPNRTVFRFSVSIRFFLLNSVFSFHVFLFSVLFSWQLGPHVTTSESQSYRVIMVVVTGVRVGVVVTLVRAEIRTSEVRSSFIVRLLVCPCSLYCTFVRCGVGSSRTGEF